MARESLPVEVTFSCDLNDEKKAMQISRERAEQAEKKKRKHKGPEAGKKFPPLREQQGQCGWNIVNKRGMW